MNNPWLGVGEAADGEEAGSARGQAEVPSATCLHGRGQAGFSEEERAGGSSDLTLGGLILGIAIGLTMDITGLIRGHTIAILGIGIQDTGTGSGDDSPAYSPILKQQTQATALRCPLFSSDDTCRRRLP